METGESKVQPVKTARSAKRLRELLRRMEEKPQNGVEGFARLSFEEQLSFLLLAPTDVRQELILSSPHAPRLVPLLPEHEAYLTVKEIGLEDAVPMISMMSKDQIRYLHDLETWQKGSFQAADFLKLLEIIRQCGEDKLAEWLDAVDPELLVLVLKEHGHVTKFDITKDPVEEDTEQPPWITYDGYYRYHPARRDLAPLLDPILRILSTRNPERYGMIMESTYADQFSEVQEEALRFRSGRLAEMGLPDFEEACEIYRRLGDEEFQRLSREGSVETRPPPGPPALYPIRLLPSGSFLRQVLAVLGPHPEADRIRMELASLANKVVVADGLEPKDPETLKSALKKVDGLLGLALEYLAGRDVEAAATWLAGTWLHYLFRLGFSQLAKLADRARRIRNQAGFPWIDRFHYLADPPFEETLRGLLMPRPAFFEGPTETNPSGFRNFSSLEDVRRARARIDATEAIALLFRDHLDLTPARIKELCLEEGLGDRIDTVRWSQVIHTCWVRKNLGGDPLFSPLHPSEVQAFRAAAFEPAPGSMETRMNPSYVQGLLDWTLERIPIQDTSTQDLVVEWIRAGAARIEEEVKDLDPRRPVDGRFVLSLCIRLRP